MNWLTSIADLILPRSCVVCGQDLIQEEENICLPCLVDLPLTRFANLSRNPMSDRLNSLIEEGPYLYATALFFYRCEYRHITPALKYGRNFAAGRYFARMLGRELAGSGLFRDADCIISVPLHWARRWKRGYNQADTIAREICRCLPGAKMGHGILCRRRRTSSQTGKKGRGKAENVQDAFRARKFKEAPSHIILIDDVFTSGNTAAACVRALKKALPQGGGTRISVATLAFAGE